MIDKKVRKILKKQHYELAGRHSAVQVCRWTKKSLVDEGFCYKEQFYGIKAHLCCQMTPSAVWCPNKCLHCWRAIELTLGEKLGKDIDSPSEIIDKCIVAQKKLLIGFKGNKKINMEKFQEAQEPMQFAISLSGEPTGYWKIGELISELRRRGKTSFLVTNGLYPEKILEMFEKNQLPTQLYVSVNIPREKDYQKFHNSMLKDAWKKLNKTLELMPKLGKKTRTVFRINLVKDINMSDEDIENFAKLIEKAKPKFIEIKGFMSVGFARQRIGYKKMPFHEDILDFSKKLSEELKKKKIDYVVLDDKEESRVAVLGNSKTGKKDLKIKKREY